MLLVVLAREVISGKAGRGDVMQRLFLSLGILWGTATTADAYCSEPYGRLTVPDVPGSFARPDVPYCLSSYQWSGRHECDSWELESYKREVEEYIEKLNSYVGEANDLARKAQQFAQEAYDYAVCEAEEVSKQHQ